MIRAMPPIRRAREMILFMGKLSWRKEPRSGAGMTGEIRGHGIFVERDRDRRRRDGVGFGRGRSRGETTDRLRGADQDFATDGTDSSGGHGEESWQRERPV